MFSRILENKTISHKNVLTIWHIFCGRRYSFAAFRHQANSRDVQRLTSFVRKAVGWEEWQKSGVLPTKWWYLHSCNRSCFFQSHFGRFHVSFYGCTSLYDGAFPQRPILGNPNKEASQLASRDKKYCEWPIRKCVVDAWKRSKLFHWHVCLLTGIYLICVSAMCRYFVILGTFLHIKVPTIHLQLQHGMVVLTPGTSGDSMGDPVGPKPYWGDPKAGVSRGFVLSEEYLYLIHNPDRVAYQGWYLGQMMVRHQAHMESHGILKPTSHTILYWNYTLQNHTYHILVFSWGCPCSPWFSANMTNLGWAWGPPQPPSEALKKGYVDKLSLLRSLHYDLQQVGRIIPGRLITYRYTYIYIW